MPNFEKFKGSKISDSFMEAFKKARESKDTGFFKKIMIFAKQFFNEMTAVEEEKAEVTESTKKKVDDIVAQAAVEASNDDKVDPNISQEDAVVYSTAKGAMKGSVEECGAGCALDKLAQAVAGKSVKPLELSEVFAMSGAGLLTLGKLKKRFPNESDLAEALRKIADISATGTYPLRNLMNEGVMKMLKPKGGGFTRAIEVARMCKAFQIPYGEAMKFGANYISLGVREKALALNKFVIEHKAKLFGHTSIGNVKEALKVVRNMGNEKLAPEALAKLTFLIDDNDRKKFVGFLVGKRKSPLKAAA